MRNHKHEQESVIQVYYDIILVVRQVRNHKVVSRTGTRALTGDGTGTCLRSLRVSLQLGLAAGLSYRGLEDQSGHACSIHVRK